MKTVTYEEFVALKPCWLGNDEKMSQLKGYFKAIPNMNALDMLGLDDVSIVDRFWAVLHEELIQANTLHEFACLCAEHALSKIDNPNSRSVEAIAAKRKWMRGEISNAELDIARGAAWRVATSCAARDTAWCVAWAAASVVGNEEREWQLDTLIKLLRGKQPNEKAIKVCCKTCKNNVEEPPPHTCDYCDALDTPDYFMWESK